MTYLSYRVKQRVAEKESEFLPFYKNSIDQYKDKLRI